MITLVCILYMTVMYFTFSLAMDHWHVLIPRLIASVIVLAFAPHDTNGIAVFAGLFAAFELYSAFASNPLLRRW